MIKNQLIEKKITEKTEKDHVMREFLLEILDSETKGGQQYTKNYTVAIKKGVFARQIQGDK